MMQNYERLGDYKATELVYFVGIDVSDMVY